MRQLSVIIASRNEEWLKRTVEDVLVKRRSDTEVIVILDGKWADPALVDHPDVTIVYHPESVGQRAAINEGAKISKAKYIMKLDAHCILDEGFDVKLMTGCEPNWTVIPAQYNLHAFNWKCKTCGNEWYQGPTPTKCQTKGEKHEDNPDCKGTEFERVIIWQPRKSRRTEFWRFDSDLHFQYWQDLKTRPESQGDIVDTMSLLGACFFMERDWYWKIGGSEECFGSWGQQGTEISCKTWLSGGRLVTNKNTWFAHLFRTQGGDFGFPYPQSGNQVDNARKKSKEYFREGKWKSEKPLSWLIDKFWPIPGWSEEDRLKLKGDSMNTKGIIFYTDNQLNLKIAHTVQKQLKKIGLPIVSSSLKPMNFGKNVPTTLKRGYMTMFKQILSALETLDTEYVFFCEHDVLYHPSHFDFTPKDPNVWYYNVNMWKVNSTDGHSLWTDNCKQVSGICVNRETAVKHYRERVKRLEEYTGDNFNSYVRAMGFEPGTHNRAERVDDAKSENYMSEYPNIDIRHGSNLTETRWSPEQFRNKKFTEGWKESTAWELPGWKPEDLNFIASK